VTTAVLSKCESRERWTQLRALMCEWDPIGVMDDPDWPRDEYDCLVDALLTLLASKASREEVGEYVRKEIEKHFGLSAVSYDLMAVVDRVQEWFDRGWRDLANPLEIFVALFDEGVEVWRPVQARPLRNGLFRIIGVEVDTSDETWQFPAGAIVKCEYKQFADGAIGMIAVEQIED
jgi:hypothetical protein